VRRATPLLVLALLAGCGSDDDGSSRPAETGQRTTAEQPETDEVQIRRLAIEYQDAVARRDWAGMCEMLSPRARARLDRKAGSCERGFRTTVTDAAVKQARETTAGAVKVRGDRATVAITLLGDDTTLTTLHAAKIDGRWLFYIKRAAKGAV
jgi:hypothetical protein